MNNKVVHRVTRSLVEHNVLTLRFNFRGVERSEGLFDEGVGEQDDLLAASLWLQEKAPGVPLFWCGFSFGAFVSLCAATSAKMNPSALISLGLAPRFFSFQKTSGLPEKTLWIQGDRDDFGSFEDVEELALQMSPKPTLVCVPGADHFFTQKLEELEAALRVFLGQELGLNEKNID